MVTRGRPGFDGRRRAAAVSHGGGDEQGGVDRPGPRHGPGQRSLPRKWSRSQPPHRTSSNGTRCVSCSVSTGEILARAERLPWILWSRTRAPGTSPLSRAWRLPRLTLGTSHMVLFHDHALGRRVDASLRSQGCPRRARRGRSTPARHDHDVPGVAAAGPVAVVHLRRSCGGGPARRGCSSTSWRNRSTVSRSDESVRRSLTEERLVILRATLEGLASMSSLASGSSVNDFATRLSQAGGTGLFVFAATLFRRWVLRPAPGVDRVPAEAPAVQPRRRVRGRDLPDDDDLARPSHDRVVRA